MYSAFQSNNDDSHFYDFISDFKFYTEIRPVFSPSARPLEHGCCDRNSHSCQQHSAQYSIYSAHIHCTFCYRSFLRNHTSFNRSLDQSWSDLASHRSQNPLPTNNLKRSLCPRNQSSVFSASGTKAMLRISPTSSGMSVPLLRLQVAEASRFTLAQRSTQMSERL